MQKFRIIIDRNVGHILAVKLAGGGAGGWNRLGVQIINKSTQDCHIFLCYLLCSYHVRATLQVRYGDGIEY